MNETKRVKWIDYAKGIGIILMVMGHYQYLNYEVNKWIFSFHMPLFFFISGLLTSDRNIEYKNYIIKRFRLLLIPFFIFGIITYILSFFVGKGYPINEFIINILNNRGAGMWFLHTLFLVNILYLFIYSSSKKWKIMIYTVLIILAYFSSIHNIHLPLRSEVLPICLSFFLLGDILKPYIFSLQRLNSNFIFISFILSIILNILLVEISERMDIAENRVGGSLFVLTAIFGIISILSLSLIIDRINLIQYIKSTLIFCSVNAIVILIFHPYIFSFVDKLFNHIGQNPNSIIGHISVIILQFLILYPLIIIINRYFPFLLGKWYK